MTSPTPQQLPDLYYHDLRHPPPEAPAAFDRITRAGQLPPGDLRLQRLQQLLPILADDQPDKAQRLLEALSVN